MSENQPLDPYLAAQKKAAKADEGQPHDPATTEITDQPTDGWTEAADPQDS